MADTKKNIFEDIDENSDQRLLDLQTEHGFAVGDVSGVYDWEISKNDIEKNHMLGALDKSHQAGVNELNAATDAVVGGLEEKKDEAEDSYDIEAKAAVKAALQEEVGLPVKPDVPLMVMVTRLAGHKGLDLLCYIARRLMWEEDAQLLILGTGEAQYETFFKDLANQFPEQVAAKITFNLKLASRIYAGGDIYLMPSKSEPCGLSQMNAMRYGTVPVVHATGGLKDTVPPCDENGEGGLGFTFQSYNADDFYAAVKRALDLYNDNQEAFQALQKKEMEMDFSWNAPAKKYMALFENMLSW